MLVAALNPCQCGFYGDTRRDYSCSSMMVQKRRQH
ncbi:MAG TPA: hypothetical protein DCP71_13720 [Verrucomicrobiales bacterium]|nr:hypothetical protein [Verrucomicrobiales bacterium]